MLLALIIPAFLGIVSLGIGVYALIVGQPYAIWYPLVLGGFLLSVLAIRYFFVFCHKYQQVELRKMHADELT